MVILENLYEECRSYIALKPVGITSTELLALYAFAEEYANRGNVKREVTDAAEKVVRKYQEIQIQM